MKDEESESVYNKTLFTVLGNRSLEDVGEFCSVLHTFVK